MQIRSQALAQVLEDACAGIRTGSKQSNDVVIRNARRRLATRVDDVPARNVLAASYLVRNEPRRALELLAVDRSRSAGDPLGHRIAAYAWLLEEQSEPAWDRLRQAVHLDPGQADCWNLLGRLCEHAEQPGRAVEFYERGRLFEDATHANSLAWSRLHLRQGQLKDAIHVLRVSLLRDHRSPVLNLVLARLLLRRVAVLGRSRRFGDQQRVRREALKCLQVVNAAAPTTASLLRQGRLQQQLNDFDAARDSFQEAVRRDPHSARALGHLAGAHLDFGEMELALAYYRQALERCPEQAEAHFRYSRAKRFEAGKETNAYLRQLERQLSSQRDRPQRQHFLHFALAKVHDDLGHYETAWQHYRRGNEFKSRCSAAEREGHASAASEAAASESAASESAEAPAAEGRRTLEQIVDRNQRVFTAEFLRRHSGLGMPDATPILIVGMPRSGTTLTEQILASHPDVAGGGELTQLGQIRQQCGRQFPEVFGHAPQAESLRRGLTAPAERAELRSLAQDYLRTLEAFRCRESHVTDKMPTNFVHLGLVALLFPNATVIHCRRNPMDVMVSCFCQNLRPPFCDWERLVHYHRHYRRQMRYWQRALPLHLHTVDYETLVAEPQTEARRLVEHCGLPWDDRCLAFHRHHRAVHTPSKWQVRQPLYRSSVGKWRRFQPQLAAVAEQVFSELRAEGESHRGGPAGTGAAAGASDFHVHAFPA